MHTPYKGVPSENTLYQRSVGKVSGKKKHKYPQIGFGIKEYSLNSRNYVCSEHLVANDSIEMFFQSFDITHQDLCSQGRKF